MLTDGGVVCSLMVMWCVLTHRWGKQDVALSSCYFVVSYYIKIHHPNKVMAG